MKIFTVYNKNKKYNSEAILIEEAFSFKALIFNIFWLIYHRIWWMAGLLILINITLFFLIDKNHITENVSYVIQIIVNIYLGFIANDLYRKQLEYKGWHMIDVVAAKNKDEAEFRFLDKLSTINY